MRTYFSSKIKGRRYDNIHNLSLNDLKISRIYKIKLSLSKNNEKNVRMSSQELKAVHFEVPYEKLWVRSRGAHNNGLLNLSNVQQLFMYGDISRDTLLLDYTLKNSQNMQGDFSELYRQNNLSHQMLRALGFQQAQQSSLPRHLLNSPSAQRKSCLRDAVLTALQNYNRLQRMLMNAGTIGNWNFYHVILCSLPDKVSTINRKELLLEIVKMNALWRCARFRTFFIPIGMGDQDIQEIMNICEVGGDGWVAYPTTFQDFHEQFKSVMAEIGIGTKPSLLDSEDSIPAYYERLETGSKAITLSVQASEMMKGHNWQSIINTISFYMRNLGPKDILSGIIFSATPWVITSKNPPPQPRPEPIQYQQEVINQYPIQPRRAQPGIQPILQPRPRYQQYIQPQRNACPRKCGVCCVVFTIVFIIRLVFYLSVSS